MKKNLTLCLVAIGSLASLAGCGSREGGASVDETKAQLTVATFEGGVGDQWLNNAAQIFMEKNKDRTDFQDGRVGVQINVKNNRAYGGDTIKDTDLREDIYFTENVDYYYLTNKNKLADISDVLKAENPEDGGKRIIDKIDSNLIGFMTREEKIYAVPFYDCFYGMVYDKDLFAEKGFYMTNAGEFTKNPSEFGTGPNGVAGDWDDGMPRTYEEFASMMTKMRALNVVPFTYSSGIATYYTARGLCSWWSDFEGYDDMNLNYNFNGTAHHIVDSITDGVASIKQETITKENGYLVRKQAGKYNALRFAREILTNDSKNYQGYSSNYDVQSAFVNNKYVGGSTKPIAMMFEGNWWENEASEYIDEAAAMGAESFNYGFLPIPKFDMDSLGDATLLNLNNSFGFINANAQNMKLAKEFFAFLHTDAMMSNFTATTSMTRGLKYSIQDADKSKVTSYGLDLVHIKESEHVKVVYPYSNLDFVINNSATFATKTWSWGTKAYTDNPLIAFINNKSLTAEQFFNDHVNSLTVSEWERMIH